MISGFLSIYLSLKNESHLETSTQFLERLPWYVLVSRFHTMMKNILSAAELRRCGWRGNLGLQYVGCVQSTL